jgi:uracil-DNA glycosylase
MDHPIPIDYFSTEDREKVHHILEKVLRARNEGKIIYPPQDKILHALHMTPFHRVRVVILGQDPYHGPGQAEGLSFSVPVGIPLPPSLKNIFKEIRDDLGIPLPHHGHLASWAAQGVLLLNTILTVEEGKPASHAGHGWEQLTDKIIKKLSDEREQIIFLLWGKHAQQKASLIDTQKHILLQAPHPSPLSAYQGFFGCHHFSQVNELLIKKGSTPIDWKLSDYETYL